MKPINRYPHVFRPLNVGATTLRHRIMVTGHTQLYGENGTLSERHINDIDTIVLGMTRSPNDTLYKKLVADGRIALKIGDVVTPRPIEAIIYEAENFARNV
tara:strand:- start:1212 stop:1514 length:303 start_codon:yes stop_codon:yes gene_type:complete